MSKNTKGIDWTIIPSISQLTGLIRAAEKLCKEIQKNICNRIDDPDSDAKDNMTLEEVLSYFMDIDNDTGKMQEDLKSILQLFHPGVSFSHMSVLGRKIERNNIHYLTEYPSVLYPIGAPKPAYRCWYKTPIGSFASVLIDDKSKFTKLDAWSVTPASRIFINAFYRNCPDDSWTFNKNKKYDLKIVAAEFPASMFKEMMMIFGSVSQKKIFTEDSGMEFECEKKEKGIKTRYEILSHKPSKLTTKEVKMMNDLGLFDLESLPFITDEQSMKKKIGK